MVGNISRPKFNGLIGASRRSAIMIVWTIKNEDKQKIIVLILIFLAKTRGGSERC